MKKAILSILMAVFAAITAYAATEIIDGIRYTTHGSSSVSCRLATIRADITDIVIPERVIVDGMAYTVTAVERNGFKDAKNLRTLELPNSVKRIGADAFTGCENLERVILPDEARVDILRESYGYGGNGPFAGCVRLSEVSGRMLQYPAYVLNVAFRKCDGVPFASEIPSLEPSDPNDVLLATLPDDLSEPRSDKKAEGSAEPEADVDRNIPQATIKANRRFAVIIGNQRYGDGVATVDFAEKDARVFADYCRRTLGLPEQNIRTYYNATYGTMLGALRDIASISEAYGGDIELIFYYAGHGMPDEADRSAYLMPVDADGAMTEICLPLSQLYTRLGALGARSVLVFLDACFSGAQRGDGMLMAARAVRIKPATTRPTGNVVVFSAATGDQTAYPYHEKGHGIFTYYLLEKIQQTGGDVTLGDLFEHVSTNVAQQSVVVNRKVQLPAVNASAAMDNWQNLKLR